MSNENKSIYEFDLNLIRDYFLNLERQGPGSPEVTVKALSFIDNLTNESRIIDIGCGTGGQTMVLAKHTNCHITGIDMFSKYIEQLNLNAKKLNFQSRLKGIIGSMNNLPFKNEEFDLIWSEGAIYNIGYKRGLNEWHKFLKKGGYLAVTEASWFTEKRPDEISKFWLDGYPEIDTISNKVEQMQKAGYVPVATFVLPENCWIDNYHAPQVSLQEDFLKKYSGNKNVEKFIDFQKYEAQLYNTYKEYYGYVFYIGKKI